MSVQAGFTRMDESTPEDWALLLAQDAKLARTLPDRVLAHLELLGGDHAGFPVDRLTHSLQTATLALEDGRDEEYVVCALLHDIGDTLGTFNHADVGAAILRPFVGDDNHWMIQHHAIFQGYNFFHHIGLDRNMRDAFASSPYYERTAEFIERYDNPAFDPKRKSLPLSEFEPMVRRLMAVPRHSIYLPAVDQPGA